MRPHGSQVGNQWIACHPDARQMHQSAKVLHALTFFLACFAKAPDGAIAFARLEEYKERSRPVSVARCNGLFRPPFSFLLET